MISKDLKGKRICLYLTVVIMISFVSNINSFAQQIAPLETTGDQTTYANSYITDRTLVCKSNDDCSSNQTNTKCCSGACSPGNKECPSTAPVDSGSSCQNALYARSHPEECTGIKY